MPAARRRGHLRAALRRQAPELLPGAVGPRRRRARRGPHVHLLRARGRRRPDEQLARPGRDARTLLDELFAGSHARAARCTSCPFSMGPLGSDKSHDRRPADRLAPTSRSSMRIMTRMGKGALDVLGEDGEFVPCLHSVGMPLERRRGGRAVAVQRREQVHRPLPRDARDLVLRLGLRRQRAAGQEVLRAAHRLGHGPRRGLDGRAHADPQADLARGRGRSTSPAPSRARAARPTWRC